MILFKCDRCGKVISPYVHRIRIEAFSNANYALDKPITTFPLSKVDSDISEDLLPEMMEGSQFCRDCIEQICAYAMNYNVDINYEGGYTLHTMRSRFGKQIRSLSRQRTRTMMAAS